MRKKARRKQKNPGVRGADGAGPGVLQVPLQFSLKSSAPSLLLHPSLQLALGVFVASMFHQHSHASECPWQSSCKMNVNAVELFWQSSKAACLDST